MEQFTQIQILSFDRVAFAHSLAATGYSYTLENQGYSIYGETPEDGGVLEIGFVEENPLLLTTPRGQVRIPENCIFIIPPGCGFTVRAQTGGLHRHTTAEFLVRCRCRPVDRLAPPQGQTVTLPLVISPTQDCGEVFAQIRAIANAKTAQTERSWFEECADFMLLIHRLSAILGSTEGDTVSPGNRRYCNRAKTFVSENIHRRLTVGEVAAAVGISKNYLTNIFSASEGLPLVEYINRRKLSYMLELIRRYSYTLAQAGEQVGFGDVNYISRIFRRYYGMSFSEYRHNLPPEQGGKE